MGKPREKKNCLKTPRFCHFQVVLFSSWRVLDSAGGRAWASLRPSGSDLRRHIRWICFGNTPPTGMLGMARTIDFQYGYGSIPMKIPFLVGWTSIYQLFWCSPGVPGFWPIPIWDCEELKQKNWQLRGWPLPLKTPDFVMLAGHGRSLQETVAKAAKDYASS